MTFSPVTKMAKRRSADFRRAALVTSALVPFLGAIPAFAQSGTQPDEKPAKQTHATHKHEHKHKQHAKPATRNGGGDVSPVVHGSINGYGVPVVTGGKDNSHLTYVPTEDVRVRGDIAHVASGTGTIEQARLAQKMAPNIVNMVPQSEIKKIPDFVLGDVVRRLPGASVINKRGEGRSIQIRGLDPNLNGVTFEGVFLPAGSINKAARAVPLDAIPAPLAGGLQLIKTNLPDQDATALGGQLNILSREIEPYEEPYLEVITAGGFHSPHTTKIFEGTISGGMRFGLHSDPFTDKSNSDKPFSVSFFATDTSDWTDLDDIQQSFADKAGQPENVLSKASQLEYVQSKSRWGYGGTVGWDINRNNKIYLKMFDSGIDFHPNKYQLGYSFSGYTPSTTNADAYTTKSSMTQATNDNLVHDEEKVYKFGGDSTLGKVKLDYFGAFASNLLYSPYSYSATFTNPNSVPIQVDNISNPLLPSMVATNGTNLTNYSAYKLTSLSNASQNDRDDEWTGHLGASVPFNIASVHGTISAGGEARLEHVTHNDLTYTYTNLPSVTGSQVAGSYSYQIFDNAYNLGTPIGTEFVRQLINDRTYPIVENTKADAITDQQARLDDNENVYSGYAEYSGTWRKLGMVAGMRFEKTDGVYRGTATSMQNGTTVLSPRRVGQEYANFFPTAQFRYAFTDNLIGRANWSTAVGRPGFSQVTATQTINYSTNAITQGNPNRKPTTGNNFDVSLEYYLPQGGIISAGAFDKEFKNYIVSNTVYGSYPGLTGIATYSTYSNIRYGSARGFEANYRQQFSFLPGFLKGFGVGANFTYVDSRGRSRDGVEETLPNTASHIYNFEAFYIRGPVTIQFDGNYQGLTMTSLGSTPALDSYVQPYLNFDIGARYALTKNLTVYFQGRNIGREKQNATEGSSADRFTELQYFGSSYLFGLDMKL